MKRMSSHADGYSDLFGFIRISVIIRNSTALLCINQVLQCRWDDLILSI